MIVLVDYGMGNLGSIKNMLKKAGFDSLISSSADDINRADKLVLPGVGSFDNGMEHLRKLGLADILSDKVVAQKTPILGICLGMQLFSKQSEEGVLPGLGWIDAETVRFRFDGQAAMKVPHMGWNAVTPVKDNPLIDLEADREARFYFVHSYHVECRDPDDVIATTRYGYDFTSVVRHGNIFGVQFHPEKSHKFGLRLLRNFIEKT